MLPYFVNRSALFATRTQLSGKPRQKKTQWPAKKNLFDLIVRFPNFGENIRFYRKSWDHFEEPCYWTVTRVELNNQLNYGKIWGRLTWKGVELESEKRITSPLKREWRYIPNRLPTDENLRFHHSTPWNSILFETPPSSSTNEPTSLKQQPLS